MSKTTKKSFVTKLWKNRKFVTKIFRKNFFGNKIFSNLSQNFVSEMFQFFLKHSKIKICHKILLEKYT